MCTRTRGKKRMSERNRGSRPIVHSQNLVQVVFEKLSFVISATIDVLTLQYRPTHYFCYVNVRLIKIK